MIKKGGTIWTNNKLKWNEEKREQFETIMRATF